MKLANAFRPTPITWTEPKRQYKPGTPGYKRSDSWISLTTIKKNIKKGLVPRRFYQDLGELGPT